MPASAPKSKSSSTNRQYFRQLLKDRKMVTRGLAKLMGMHQASLVRAFQGKQPFKSHETAKLAELLQVPLEDILRNLNIEVPQQSAKGGKVPVTGWVRAGKVGYGKAAGPRTVAAPPKESGAGMQALRYEDDGPLDGAYLYFRPAADVQPNAMGRLCVCAIAGGEEIVVATPSTKQAGVYTLRDLVGRVLKTDVWLESASPIVWIKI